MNGETTLLHIAKKSDYEAAVATGAYVPPGFAADGFIHFSSPDQVLRVANFLFRGTPGLVLLLVDPARVKPVLKYENLEGGVELFPHVYGPLNLDAVIGTHGFPPGAGGCFALPEAVANALAARGYRRPAPVERA